MVNCINKAREFRDKMSISDGTQYKQTRKCNFSNYLRQQKKRESTSLGGTRMMLTHALGLRRSSGCAGVATEL